MSTGAPIDPETRTTWREAEFAHDTWGIGSPHAEAPEDVVLGPGPATTLVANLVPWRPVGRALDLATGCGALAILAARHATEVIATDINPRALEYTRHNAQINGLTQIEVRQGDLFEPVDGEQFDLISANLPFVLSPGRELLFRDGTETRDASVNSVVRRALGEVSARLTDDGVAVFLANWIVHDLDAPTASAVTWLREVGLGGLILWHSVDSPESYARRWSGVRAGNTAGAPVAADVIDRWDRHLRTNGAIGVAQGAIIVRRDADHRVRIVRSRHRTTEGGGEQVARILSAPIGSDDSWSTERPQVVAPWTASFERHYDRESMTGDPVVIRNDRTCGVPVRVDADVLPVFELLDGRMTLGDAIAATDRQVDDTYERRVIAAVRHAIAVGVVRRT